MNIGRLSAALWAGTVLATPLAAQDNMDKLTNMQKTGAAHTFIAQDGERAEAP